MGQAAVDLPDPLQEPSPAQSGGADDLLSQLAGAEIDRLLAEADIDKPADDASPAEPAAAIQDTAVATISEPADTVGIGSELDALLSEESSSPDNALNALPESPVAAEALLAKAAEVETSAEERMALGEGSEQASLNSENPNSERAGLTEDDAEPLPLWLRPLAWINAPLDFLSDPVREAMGKVALLTLFNALAVLVYVMFVRHGK